MEKNFLNKPSDMGFVINLAVVNVLWHMMINERKGDLDDDENIKMAQKLWENMEAFQEALIMTYFPWIYKYIPMPIYKHLFPHYRTLDNNEYFYSYAKKKINEHVETLDKDNPRDLIDNYLIDRENKYDENYEDLLSVMQDMFMAGSETTATTIRWVIIHMALHPEIQKK